MTLYKGNKVIAGSRSYIGNIGDIKYTARVDLPFGGSWCDGSIKLKAQFPTVYQMLIDGKLQALDIATYESALNLNGSCGFFGLDTATESFRVPSLNDVYIKSGQVADEFGAESLPNITGEINIGDSSGPTSSASGAFEAVNGGVQATGWDQDEQRAVFIFSASRVSSAYQDGAKVNPDHVKYRAYVVLYTGADTNIDITKEIQLNNPFSFGMSQWLESDPKNASWLLSDGAFHSGAIYESFYNWLLSILNGETVEGVSVKASTDTYGDYDYVVNTTEETFRLPIYDGSESIPNWKKTEDLAITVPSSGYTIEKKGFYNIRLSKDTSGQGVYLKINGIDVEMNSISANWESSVNVFLLSKGDVVSYSGPVYNVTLLNFIYATGNGSLYFYVGETVQDANLINASKVLDLLAKLESYDYVVESKTSTADDPSWYRVYKSGWVEQGGISSDSSRTATLTVAMADINYSVSCIQRGTSGPTSAEGSPRAGVISTTQIFVNGGAATNDVYWEVKGQGA